MLDIEFLKVDHLTPNTYSKFRKILDRSTREYSILNFGEENISSISAYHRLQELINNLKDLDKKHFLFNQTADPNILNQFLDSDSYSIINTDLFNTYLPTYLGFQKNLTSYTFERNVPLLQMGNFNQCNRLSLLLSMKKLFGNKLLYGFYPSRFWEDESIEQYYEYLTDYITIDKKELKNFIFNLENKLDLNANMDNTGFPYKTWPYEQTSISIIPETVTPFETNHENNFLNVTEKTYRTILNNQPFILFGGRGQIEKLNSYGFNTFNNLFEIQDYNDPHFIENYENNESNYYFDIIEKNIVHFINRMNTDSNFFNIISDMCTHNFDVLTSKFHKTRNDHWFFSKYKYIEEYFKNTYNFDDAYLHTNII